jgi:HD-GYP domain-containing protein (c-di-GMP phosphodiesterase class II)
MAGPTVTGPIPAGPKTEAASPRHGMNGPAVSAAGFVPIPIGPLPVSALAELAVYVQNRRDLPEGSPAVAEDGLNLYCRENVEFTAEHRQRLLDHGTRCVYIKSSDLRRFARRSESRLASLAADPVMPLSDRAALVYSTGVEMLTDLTSQPSALASSNRPGRFAEAAAVLVGENPDVLRHLLAVADRDFSPAAHQAKVGTWMAALAHAMGRRTREEVALACRAGLVHDLGMLGLPTSLLNKTGRLTDAEQAMLRQHPQLGAQQLAACRDVDPLLGRIVMEHHERMDGSGYPRGLRGEEIHELSRMCAVLESFDAMTAVSPFKPKPLPMPVALDHLARESPGKYDAATVKMWRELVLGTGGAGEMPEGGSEQRVFKRFAFNCAATVAWLDARPDGTPVRPPLRLTAHNVSRGGVGLLSAEPIPPGDHVRIFLHAPGWEGRSVVGTTVRCRQYDDTLFEVGVRFGKVRVEK